MAFLAVVLALSAVQLIGLRAHWRSVHSLGLKACAFPLGRVLFILLPTVLVAVFYLWLSINAWLLALPLAAAVLWLSIATGEHKQALEHYINAGRASDWPSALASYQQMGGQLEITEGDWQGLNKAVLERAAYLGFSQFFAPMFWFCLLGPAGALGYRLAVLASDIQPEIKLMRLIWIIEWPAVRLLGLTFAFTGNFLSCMERWIGCLLCTQRSSADIITHYVLGALGVMEGNRQTLEVTRRELFAMARLLRRSLWFWVGLLAIAALRGW
jgi:AmpE protein